MIECHGKKYILNGELNPSESFDNALVYEGDSIYEVIRIVKGSPVFFQEHMERLETSVHLKQMEMLTSSAMLRNDIKNLIRSDKKKETNIKIVFNYKNGAANYLVYYIEPIYPTDEQYKKGVKGILFFAERKDPGSKVIDHKLRSSIYHRLIHDGGYEALLVNENNLITEGSRSNIFFMKDDRLVSAPDKYVLSGITRKIILEICHENGINVELKCVKPETISEYDAVFMTGTSPMVLPFNCIGDAFFNVKHPLIGQLRKLYMQKMEESILRFRTE